MAEITATDMRPVGAQDVTEVTLGASDTLTYKDYAQTTPVLYLRNPTASPITVNIDGDGQDSVAVPGVGTVDVSAGLDVGPIAADEVVAVRLHSIREYLKGTVTLTGGTGLVASLLEF